MSNQSADSGTMPPDGFYIASVLCDGEGSEIRYVRVFDGVPYTTSGVALNPSACSEFEPLHSGDYFLQWPNEAAAELDTLRTANAGLVERVRHLEASIRAMHGCIHGGRFAAMSADEIISGKAAL